MSERRIDAASITRIARGSDVRAKKRLTRGN